MNKQIESLYLHFPFCAHLCNYCDFYKRVPLNKTEDYNHYHQYLEQSFFIHQSLMEKHGYSWAPLKTLYIGGGTPSLWGVEGKIFLEEFLRKNKITISSDCEFTLEVNPGAWNDEVLSEWRKLGANRFSLGIQALNPEMITYLDRIHSIQDVFDTLEYFKINKLNFSVDFMLGLPYSEKFNRDAIKELAMALEYNPSHFSVYILTVKDNYKHFLSLPTEEWIEKEFLEVAAFLKSRNFLHYEVSSFSLPDKQSKHNLNYWKSKTVAALGPSATGLFGEEKIRYKWQPNSPKLDFEYLTNEEFKLENIYMAIRSQQGIRLADFPDELVTIVEKWKLSQCAIEENGSVYLTSKGYLVLDSLMNDLFQLKLV